MQLRRLTSASRWLLEKALGGWCGGAGGWPQQPRTQKAKSERGEEGAPRPRTLSLATSESLSWAALLVGEHAGRLVKSVPEPRLLRGEAYRAGRVMSRPNSPRQNPQVDPAFNDALRIARRLPKVELQLYLATRHACSIKRPVQCCCSNTIRRGRSTLTTPCEVQILIHALSAIV